MEKNDIECHNLETPLSYDAIEALLLSENKRLPTEIELTDWLASNGGQAVLEGDNWAPIRNTDDTKDTKDTKDYI